MSADAEMEVKICDFLRKKGKSTALVISKAFAGDKKLVNKHLYNLERSKKVFRTDDQPPVWNLLENKSQKTDEEEEEAAAACQSTEAAREEERVRNLLKSGGLKASQIAGVLKQDRRSVNKQLYRMREEGQVQKHSETNRWTLNDGEKTEESNHRLASLSGLSQSFYVIETLGSGAFGDVYKVEHKFDGQIYAVKKVELTGKADSEVKALARLDHPNIVRYITCWPDSENWTDDDDDDDDNDDEEDVNTSGLASLSLNGESAKSSGNHIGDEFSPSDKTYLFIQMEFCKGGTLTSWIKDRNFMHKQRVTVETNKIFYEIITGVEYIHSEKLIHRDLKPDNILFSADGKVKIGDFGLVAVLENHSMGAKYRTQGKGTPSYMSPEQDSKTYNEKTDIFPLGLIWFEMLWKLSTFMEREKLFQGLRHQRRFPEGFCDKYRTENMLIKMMLCFKPEDRPSAEEIKLKMWDLLFLDQNQLSQRSC